MRRLVFILALLAGLASACGGGGNDASQGAQTISSSTPSSAAPSTAATDPRQQELDVYLAAVAKPRQAGNLSEGRASKFFRNVHLHGYDGWDAAAAQSRRTAFTVTQVADKLARIVPPGELARVHAAYAAIWRADAATYTDLASVLGHHDFLDWDLYNSRFRQDDRAVSRYRLALIAYASKHNLRLPPWVRTIGA